MADAKSALARDGTMQVTAKEGIEYLKSEGKTTLLQYQGLVDPPEDKPSVPRDGTMAVTAKEGEQILESVGGAPDEDAQTRGQARKIDELKNETEPEPEPSPKKPKISKDSTMVATAKEAKDLLGKEKLGDTRQETAKKSSDKTTPKRAATMAKTLEEAKFVLEGKEVDVTEGRRTRSHGKTPPAPAKTPVKRAGTMQKTAKEGKEYLKRGKGKGKKSTESEEAEEESSGKGDSNNDDEKAGEESNGTEEGADNDTSKPDAE